MDARRALARRGRGSQGSTGDIAARATDLAMVDAGRRILAGADGLDGADRIDGPFRPVVAAGGPAHWVAKPAVAGTRGTSGLNGPFGTHWSNWPTRWHGFHWRNGR